jgi:PhnB protein
MPLGETFFAKAFGMVQDKFGVAWMVLAGQKNP